jgi:hypothetical protein
MSPTSVVAAVGPAASTLQGLAIDVSSSGGARCQTCRQHPLRGPPLTSPTSVVAAAVPTASTPREPTINVSNSGSGRCQTYRQQPPRGPPSTSPTSVVAAARPTTSTPQGAYHRHLQLWWLSLPDLPPAPPKGPTINVSNFGGGRCQTCRQHPPGGLPSMSLTPVLAATGPTTSTIKGPANDISNFSGGHCRTCRQHPPGGPPSMFR